MPALNWDTFKNLPQSPDKNFELLCRAIVRQNFGSYGVFRALANQPGVEFHLRLDMRCDPLGDAGRWWGWQCKWYELPTSGDLGTTRRGQIKDGIKKAQSHIPGLTDWVLWTRRPLSSKDQKWFDSLTTKLTLHLWTGDEIHNNLVGQATILRSTYFGELVLTPDILQARHEQAVAPIRQRWLPEVHHVAEAEQDIRRMLGEVESWDLLRALAVDLHENVAAIEAVPAVPQPLDALAAEVIAISKQSADILDRVVESIRHGDLELLRDEIGLLPRDLPANVLTAPRRLRSRNHCAGLYATNAVAGCRALLQGIRDVDSAFSSRVVAVLAPAGCGKTQLAAQLTAATATRPCGVLLHGRWLHANHSLDDLAREVKVGTHPVPSMESLLAAVDAAGQRARHRLPIVIDGLNESEDPRNWKPLLASLEVLLAKYPYVLLVCTLRPEFVGDALPEETRRVELKDFGTATVEVIRNYFRHWKIDATDASLPVEILQHPLTLRLFCEVTNPKREKHVSVNAMPQSLTALFDRYLEQVSEQVVKLAPRTHRFFAQDVTSAISLIAHKLWDSQSRSIASDELRCLLHDAQRPWDQSLVRAFEHEGVLLRMPSNGTDAYVPVYDRLGGHIIASALLAKHGHSGFEKWIRKATTTALLVGDYRKRHPLADDVVYSLVAQVPRRLCSQQLWQMVDEPLRSQALHAAARLEAACLDAATVDALLDLVRQGDSELLKVGLEVRGKTHHPLNAEALDRVLRLMGVAERDLCWTEWLRRNHADVRLDLERLTQRWRDGTTRESDRLRALWVMWILTSTVRSLRDQATYALYWFGRRDPGSLLDLTIDALTVNDAYVSERMLAASYGVVMSHQDGNSEFALPLKKFLEQLAAALVGPSASAPTHHYLARSYVRGIVAFSLSFFAASLPDSLKSDWSFAAPPQVQPLEDGVRGATEAGRTLHMDFENYTLGRLFDHRANYDMKHVGHKAAVAHVRGVVWALGWRAATFEAIDNQIAESKYRHGGFLNEPHTERYGKKYGWIGYFTYAGMLEEQGLFPRKEFQFSDVDIDPSFPDVPPADGETSLGETWLAPSVASHETWMRESKTSIPRELLRRQTIGGQRGPWVAVHGFAKAEDRILGRKVWAFISALVTEKSSSRRLAALLNKGTRPSVSRDVPKDYYVFAGEIPWHDGFASADSGECRYREMVGRGIDEVEVEVLAHEYTWESYHSEMNRAGSALVPSRLFSDWFDLRSSPQTFDQFLPDGSRATVTVGNVDGFEGDILYIREDLLLKYVGSRAITWFAFGEREIVPYSPSAPNWLAQAYRDGANSWRELLTNVDLQITMKQLQRKTKLPMKE